MKLVFPEEDLIQTRSDLCAGLSFEDEPLQGTPQRALDRSMEGLIEKVALEEQFKGKRGQTLLLHTHGKVASARILLYGAGPRKDFRQSDLRAFAAKVARTANGLQQKSACIIVPEGAWPLERTGQFLAEGALLGAYLFDKYLTGDRKKPATLEELKLWLPPSVEDGRAQVMRGAARGEAVARGVRLARDLVNEPAAEMTPRRLAQVARDLAERHGLEARVLGREECAKLGMGMFLAVAQGSEEEPQFIHLAYRPKGQAVARRVVLVGKGVTFDSGGLSLKPTQSMQDMKIDMAGAASVIAAITVLAELACPLEVHALCACTENMPSGKAYKLGDVLRSMSGKTVEINNTDAEGRLTLGDALTYAISEIKPDEIFDFATLTGACMIALGPHVAGVMGNRDELIQRWLAASKRAGEDMWHLPLPDRLKEMLKSDVADMKNTGDRYGGALTAGLFLKEFVGETPWVHVDLAGPASAEKEWAHQGKGATGFGVATIVEYLSGGDAS